MQGTVQGTGGLSRRSGSAGQAAVVAQVVAEVTLLEGFQRGVGESHLFLPHRYRSCWVEASGRQLGPASCPRLLEGKLGRNDKKRWPESVECAGLWHLVEMVYPSAIPADG